MISTQTDYLKQYPFEQLQVYLFLLFFLNKMHTNLYYAID